ncbi:MAG: 16S rRNA (guanine(527)-N(7))-methyltransferase RsmG [bacterium]
MIKEQGEADRIKEEINEFLHLEICSTETVLHLLRYYRTIMFYKRKVNLISEIGEEDFVRYHVMDSLSPLKWGLIGENDRLCDVGSGGGLPAIPLKIVLRGPRVVMVESRGKKAKALIEIIKDIGLKDVAVRNQRAEEMVIEKEEAKFDVVTVRAVGSVEKMLKFAGNILRVNGRLIAFKTETDDVDVNYLVRRGFYLIANYDYDIKGLRKRRRLHVMGRKG